MILSESSVRKIMRLLIEHQLSEVDDGMGLTVDSMIATEVEEPQDHDVDISGLKSATKEVIDRIFSYAKAIKHKPDPVVTSAFRGPEKQAEVMYANWKLEGGGNPQKGTDYLIDLYNNETLAKEIGETFENTSDVKEAIKILEVRDISAHATGECFDLRSKDQPKLKALLDIMVAEFSEKNITIEIVDERDKKAPHWHIRVK